MRTKAVLICRIALFCALVPVIIPVGLVMLLLDYLGNILSGWYFAKYWMQFWCNIIVRLLPYNKDGGEAGMKKIHSRL